MATVDLAFDEIFEEAFENAGKEMRTGYDLKTARRSFNLLMMEWANRGLNLWTIESGTIAVTAGTSVYALPVGTIDLIETVIRTSNNQDYNLYRMAVGTWAKQSNKSTTGRPTQIYIERILSPQVTLWPVPDAAYTFVYWRLQRIDGVTSGIGQDDTLDMPPRFVPALVAGLAYRIAAKSPDLAHRVQPLKMDYDEQWRLASDEDRDRASYRVHPGGNYG